MTREEAIAQPRHHRQVRHRRVLRSADRRPAEGRAAHRPVRRRLLLRLHRRRPRRGGEPPRRASRRGRACAGSRPATASSRSRPSSAPPAAPSVMLHLKDDGDGVRRRLAAARRWCATTPTTSPSRALPKEGDEERRPRRRLRGRQPGAGAVDAAAHRNHGRGVPRASTSTSRTTATDRWPGATTGSRASASTPACSTCPRSAPFDLFAARAAARPQALRAARVHHGRRRAVPAGVPALRQGRRRFERPAAQRLARDAAAGSREVEAMRSGAHARALELLARPGRRTRKEKYATFWREFGRVLKEGLGEDPAAGDSCCRCCASPAPQERRRGA